MNPSDPRLPTALEAALGHVRATAAQVAERVSATLGNQTQSALRAGERDLILAAQVDLRRKINTFHLAFAKALMDKAQEQLAPKAPARPKGTDWTTLSLVDDSEVEERMFSERIGQQITHTCEWQLRELGAYMGAVLQLGHTDEERNPLRADILGMALFRAIEAVTPDAEGRKLLAREFGQAMAQAMPECYATILRDLQERHVQPVGLTVKTVDGPGNLLPGLNSAYASLRDDIASTRPVGSEFQRSTGTDFGSGRSSSGASLRGGAASSSSSSSLGSGTGRSGGSVSAADAELMRLLRRLTFLASRPGGLDAGAGGLIASGFHAATSSGGGESVGLHGAIGALHAEANAAVAGTGYRDGLTTGLMAVNLIRAHREELMQASSGKLDHMVIDVVGSLFDQILSDARVHPQVARQIARLQLPVLRVALVDANFFSSRRHPVRRFVNRIASLACAFDEFDDGPGKQFLDRVQELVQEIVEGDFDQLDLYTAKLEEIERFIANQTEADAKQSSAAKVLETKESELHVQQRFMLQLRTSLAPIPMPDYLRDFVAQVWSQALVQAVRRHGVDSDPAKRFRQAGRDLVMSVQPKGSPVMRKRFLMQLPTLMKDLNEGLKAIGWPEAAQKEFFGKLLPSHADSLKAPPMSELDHNMMAKQLEGIFNAHVPGSHEFSTAEPVTLASQEIEQRFSHDEAQQVGLIEESAVDWSGKVDIDLSAEAVDSRSGTDTGTDTLPSDIGIDINLELVAADPAEPSQGPRLIDHIKLGFAYQMLLKDEWQKVRLSYVSPGRNFFVFTRGRKHQETISLTSRMLARMCETHRMRAVEHAYLMERATARARKQLAALKASGKQ
jgi:hypothetical protein